MIHFCHVVHNSDAGLLTVGNSVMVTESDCRCSVRSSGHPAVSISLRRGDNRMHVTCTGTYLIHLPPVLQGVKHNYLLFSAEIKTHKRVL